MAGPLVAGIVDELVRRHLGTRALRIIRRRHAMQDLLIGDIGRRGARPQASMRGAMVAPSISRRRQTRSEAIAPLVERGRIDDEHLFGDLPRPLREIVLAVGTREESLGGSDFRR